MSTRLFSRQDWNQTLPGGLPGNAGTIAWSVGLSLLVIISVPALLIWRRRRKVVKAQMAKTAEGAAAWRAHRAREREEAQGRYQRFLWHREDREADVEAAARQADQETVPGYEARGTGDGRPPDYEELEMQPLPPAHVREYYAGDARSEHGPSARVPPPPAAGHGHRPSRSQALQPGTVPADVQRKAASPEPLSQTTTTTAAAAAQQMAASA